MYGAIIKRLTVWAKPESIYYFYCIFSGSTKGNFVFYVNPQVNVRGVISEDLDGQFTGPCRPIHDVGNLLFKIV